MFIISSKNVVFPEPGGPVIKICGRSDIIERIVLKTESCPCKRIDSIIIIVFSFLRLDMRGREIPKFPHGSKPIHILRISYARLVCCSRCSERC
jgi:hypothetical protein